MDLSRLMVVGVLVGGLLAACEEQVAVNVNCVTTAAPAVDILHA